MKCLGLGVDSLLGYGTSSEVIFIRAIESVPYMNFSTDVKQIEVGCNHKCVLFVNGKVKCFGDEAYGQTGYSGEVKPYASLDDVPYVNLGARVVSQISVACQYTCVRFNDSGISCFGYIPVGFELLTVRWNNGIPFNPFGIPMKMSKLVTGKTPHVRLVG